MSNFKIVVTDGFSVALDDLNWDALKLLGDVEVFDRTLPSEKISRCADADAVLSNKVVFGETEFVALPKLKYIGVLATGYNNIDIAAASAHSVRVTNIPAYGVDSVAQLVFAHLLNISNSVETCALEIRAGAWSKSPDFCFCPRPQVELAGKSIGIIGYGAIGKTVARIASAFGMKVSAYSPSKQSGSDAFAEFKPLEQVLESSDIISLNCPLNDATLNMINSNSIAKMKRGVWIINTGRGPLVDEQAMAKALCNGEVGAYATDVLSVEPARADNPLLNAPNCTLSGHMAWMTREARTRLMNIAIDNLRAFKNGDIKNAIC